MLKPDLCGGISKKFSDFLDALQVVPDLTMFEPDAGSAREFVEASMDFLERFPEESEGFGAVG